MIWIYASIAIPIILFRNNKIQEFFRFQKYKNVLTFLTLFLIVFVGFFIPVVAYNATVIPPNPKKQEVSGVKEVKVEDTTKLEESEKKRISLENELKEEKQKRESLETSKQESSQSQKSSESSSESQSSKIVEQPVVNNTQTSSAYTTNSTVPATQQPSNEVVKKSSTNICHAPGTTYYNQTKYFTPYNTLQECLNSGGRLPKR